MTTQESARLQPTSAGQPALLIADSDIPTTRLLERELREPFPGLEVRVANDLFGADVTRRAVIISRLCFPRFSWLPAHLAQQPVPYAYFLDDNFWELTVDTDVELARFFQHPATVDTLDDFVRHSKVVIAWSRRLQDYVAARFPGHPTEYVRPGFDVAKVLELRARLDADATPRESIGDVSQRTRGQRPAVRIGYPSTRRPRVAPLLTAIVAHFLQKYPNDVQFEFIGWMPESVADFPNVLLHPWVNSYDAYLELKLSRRWDIGLAPLIGEGFDQYKTDNKYREYAGCRVPAVYSRVSPFVETVRDGETGLLVDNDAQAWIVALERLVADPELRSGITERAFADVCANYDLRTTGRLLAAAIVRHVGEY